MSATILSAIFYILLSILTAVVMTGLRAYLILVKGRPATSFKPSGEGESAWLVRLTRVHANLYESAPIMLGVLLLAIALDQTEITDSLAYLFIATRLVQMLVHLVSTSEIAIKIRYAAFLVQIAIASYWLYLLLLLV